MAESTGSRGSKYLKVWIVRDGRTTGKGKGKEKGGQDSSLAAQLTCVTDRDWRMPQTLAGSCTLLYGGSQSHP